MMHSECTTKKLVQNLSSRPKNLAFSANLALIRRTAGLQDLLFESADECNFGPTVGEG